MWVIFLGKRFSKVSGVHDNFSLFFIQLCWKVSKPFSSRRKSLKTSVLGCPNVLSDDWKGYQLINIVQNLDPGLSFDFIGLLILRFCKSLEDPKVHGGSSIVAHLQKLDSKICNSVRIYQSYPHKESSTNIMIYHKIPILVKGVVKVQESDNYWGCRRESQF